MKIGTVGQDRHVRAFRPGCIEELPVLAVNPGNVRHDLHESDHRKARRVHHRPDARRPHAWTGAAEELDVREALAESGREARRIEVPGGFPGGDQDLDRQYRQPTTRGGCLQPRWRHPACVL